MRFFLWERFGSHFELSLATRIPAIFVESPKTILRRIASAFFLPVKARSRVRLCADELLQGRTVALNFSARDRRKAFQVSEGEKELAYLAQRIPSLILVPVVFLWRRKRTDRVDAREFHEKLLRGIWAPIRFPKDILLGNPAHPTFVRKLAILLRQYERSTLRLTAPIEILSANVKMVRRKIVTSILQEKKIVLGPAITPPKFIGEGILRSTSFARLVRSLAAEEEVPELTLYRRAEKYFNEMAADFSYSTIEGFSWVLSWIFHRIFRGVTVNEEAFDKLRLAAREGPLLVIPSHKSYFDFLIMSYLFFQKDIAPPYIAAGINLGFWPFGPIARTAGAFFIRRSFRGNVLYTEILRRYVAALLHGRHNVEFFIEGARSRSGKLAPPKYGMLKMIVDSYYEGLVREKVQVVPVAINYEKVTEAKSHKRELEGGEKVQESFVNLAKSSRILFKSFGEVHVRIAEPISLEEWLERQIGGPAASTDTRRLGVQKLAFEVCHRINKSTPLNANGLVTAILLAKPGAAMLKSELEAWLLRVHSDLKAMNVLLARALEEDYMKSCRRSIAGFLEDGIIEKYHTPSGKLGLRVPHKQRVAALYYKNTAIHALLTPALSGIARGSQDELLELRGFFQFEFFFPEKEIFLRQVLHIPPGVATGLYALMLDDVLENIEIGLRALLDSGAQTLSAKDWRALLLKYGKTALLESQLQRLEAVNTQGFSAFIDMAKNRKWLLPTGDEEKLKMAGAPELEKALARIRHFRQKAREWETLRAEYQVLHEEEAARPQEAP